MEKTLKRNGMQTMQRRRKIFYWIGLALPLAQFLLLYVYVNIDSILLCFQEYNVLGEKAGLYTFNGLNNFKEVFQTFADKPELVAGIGRSLLVYLFGLIQMPIHILAAWYAVKKKPFAATAHIILYIPSILSSMVSLSITKYFFCESVPEIVKLLTGKTIPSLLDSGDHMQTFWAIVINSSLMGVTNNLLIYAGAMNTIDDSVLEAAELDGITPFGEFIYIYLPLISPTIATYFILGLAGILTADIGLFEYFGEGAPKNLHTLGYFITVRTKNSTYETYPFLAAFNMSIALVTIPITLLGKYVSNKITRRFE